MLGFDEFLDAGRELVIADLVPSHVQSVEDDLVHRPAETAACPPVGRLRIGEQVKRRFEEALADVQLAAGGDQLRLKIGSLGLELGDLLLEFVSGPVWIADEVEVLLFTGVELPEAFLEPPSDAGQGAELIGNGALHVAMDGRLELRTQADAGVVPLDCCFEAVDRVVRLAADALLSAAAGEVEVDAAVALAALDDEPQAALAAPQEAGFEVVVVQAPAGATATVEGKHPLDPVEQLLVDKRLVAALVLLALIDDGTDVVAVSEHFVDAAQRQGLDRETAGTSGAQAGFRQQSLQLDAAVLTGGEQLETPTHKWCALGVNGDRPNLALRS